jgi:hypothetical protein
MVGYLEISISDDASSQQGIKQKIWLRKCAINKLTLIRNPFANVSENRLFLVKLFIEPLLVIYLLYTTHMTSEEQCSIHWFRLTFILLQCHSGFRLILIVVWYPILSTAFVKTVVSL